MTRKFLFHSLSLSLSRTFLAPTGALEEGILCVRASVRACVCDIIQMIIENEF